MGERQIWDDVERLFAKYKTKEHIPNVNGVSASSNPSLGVKRPNVTMGECQVCDDIRQLFADSSNEKEVVLGSFEQALASPCQRHTPIIHAFKDYVGSSCSSTDVGFRNGGCRGTTTDLWESVTKLGHSFGVLLARKEDPTDHPGTARILDPEWVDMDLLKYWVAQCGELHTSCTTAMNTLPTVPALLVDVKRRRVVSGVNGYRYVALSYRFGTAAHFPLKSTLLERLGQDFALDSPDIIRKLPLTIIHAIALVGALGERYLWTDTLCITHDDPSALAGQLEQMAAIYSSALFTIVASDGDGTIGIVGLPGISEPRKLTQQVFEFGAETLVRHPRDHIHGNLSGYHQRGWTYQEFLMSARKLVFSMGEAHWLCQCCEWHESLVRDVEIDPHLDHRPQLLVAGFPQLSFLQSILGSYNDMDLTYDEDALPAIAGLLAVLSRTFTGGFLHGLPEMMFDTALGWDMHWSPSTMTKRVPSQSVRHDQDMSTWSWLSWQGDFIWEFEELQVVDAWPGCKDGEVWFHETSPITECYASSALEGEPRRKIVPTWYRERERVKDPHQPLADGWSRHESTAGLDAAWTRLFPDGCGSYVYKHRDSLKSGHDQYWYYPFHIPSIKPSTPFFNPPQMRYLFCRTWKATVLACRREPSREEYLVSEKGYLRMQEDVDGPEIGILKTQTDEQLSRWSEPEESSKDNAKPITHRLEVVAINRDVKFSNRNIEFATQGGSPTKREEYVTVLWVEWQGGVAYRQACGKIGREAWESLDLEEIDLILG
jgi:hypothetical protein